jgi:hypothetical protein
MGDLRVRFLGSGDAFGSGGRLQSCILIPFVVLDGRRTMASRRCYEFFQVAKAPRRARS